MSRRGLLCGAFLAFFVFSPGPTYAQIGAQQSETIQVVIDSGVHANPSLRTEVVYHTTAHFGDTAWFRLMFDEARLAVGSYLRVTSLADGAFQDLDAETLGQWQYTSAYFNGGDALLELFAGPNTEGNSFRIGSVMIGAPPGPTPDTLCDGDDDRVVDDRNGIARMVTLQLNGPCSATIVSENGCFFSAGHCVNILGVAEFNVPLSTPGGTMQHPGPQDQYIVDTGSIVSINGGVGNDFAYFTCFPNTQTGLTPLAAEGVFYPLAKSLPPIGTELRITGFGLEVGGGVTNNAQQTDTGPLVNIGTTSIGHRVDTEGGNSGSGIIIDATNELIGIHTHGGCNTSPGSFNEGTSILHPELQPGLICCEPPTVTADPQPASVCSGDPVSFTVESTAESPTYQWLHDGGVIPGATQQTYTIPSVAPADAGEYACIVADPCETISDAATLTVDPPPDVLMQPVSTTACIGGSASFHIQIAGVGPFTYQWQFGGVDIPGATEDTLLIDPVTNEDFGTYRCAIGDGCGEGLSNPATLLPTAQVQIVTHPFDVQAMIGQSVFMAVAASGGNLSYQWRREGIDLPGQTSSSVFLLNVQCADAGQYDVVVSNACDSVSSNPATLTVATCVGLGPGDANGDGDIDLFDYQRFLECVTGPGGTATLECEVFDFDDDVDVDRHDAAAFQRVFTGN